MPRRITYRSAFFGFLVAFLWLVIGGLALLSPIPSALDISWEFFGAWIVLFFLLLAGSGAMLTIASLNGLTSGPPRPRAQPSAQPGEATTRWAPPHGATPAPRRRP
jgi:hypothetical protein